MVKCEACGLPLKPREDHEDRDPAECVECGSYHHSFAAYLGHTRDTWDGSTLDGLSRPLQGETAEYGYDGPIYPLYPDGDDCER